MPFSLKRLGAAGLASLLLVAATDAFAQAKKPAHPAPAAPAQAQPAPAQPAQAQPAGIAVEQGDAVEEEGRRERAEQEVLQRGFLGQQSPPPG